jgi:hypothetical protein
VEEALSGLGHVEQSGRKIEGMTIQTRRMRKELFEERIIERSPRDAKVPDGQCPIAVVSFAENRTYLSKTIS